MRSIEYLEDEWLDGIATNMRFLDAAPAAYSGTAISTLSSGLSHLEGETVEILAEGAPHPSRVVTSGSITLDAAYTDIVVGLPYTSTLKTLRLEVPDPAGSTTGRKARIDHVSLRLLNSYGGEMGDKLGELDPVVYRSSGDLMDEPIPLFTGDLKAGFRGGFEREKVIIIQHSGPSSFNLLSINLFMSTSDR
jgi:hypothetical protein